MVNNFRIPRKLLARVVILIIPLLILLPGLHGFPYPPQEGVYSDISITHYPNALFLHNAIFREHIIPLWSPTILSGYPFNANPLSGLWYPPGWLAILLPLPLAFNVCVFLHLLWAGIGMYLLLRREKVTEFSALFGAIAFVAMPKLFGHYGAGHLTLLYAVAWTPWLLLLSRNNSFCDTSPKTPRWQRVINQPGLVWAMILLADVRWAAFAGLLWWFYVLVHAKSGAEKKTYSRILGALGYQTLLGLFLAAPLLLPLLEYTGLSTRANMSVEDMLTFSLPPLKAFGFFFPDFGGFYEWIVYSGALVLLLASVGFARTKQTTASKFWIGVALVSFILSLGSYLPYITSIRELPGLNLLRVPSRMIFLTGFSLAALAAHQLQWLISGLQIDEVRRSRFILVGLVVFVLLFTAGLWIISGKPSIAFIWGSIFLLIGAIWLKFFLDGRLNPQLWQIGLLIMCLLDLSTVDFSLFRIRAKQAVLAEGAQVASYLSGQPGDFRIYSPSYSLPQQTAASYELELASAVDPLQLQSYANFMESASGVPQEGYSVVLPPLEGDNPDSANEASTPDAKLLGLLNVGYILTGYPLTAEGLDWVQDFNGVYVYKNRYALPRAWVQSDNAIVPAEIISRQANVIRLNAIGPGTLSLAEVFYPGWRVWVDGHDAEILETVGILRSVKLESGGHQVIFRYLPKTLYLGFGLMALGLFMAVLRGMVSI